MSTRSPQAVARRCLCSGSTVLLTSIVVRSPRPHSDEGLVVAPTTIILHVTGALPLVARGDGGDDCLVQAWSSHHSAAARTWDTLLTHLPFRSLFLTGDLRSDSSFTVSTGLGQIQV